MPLTAQIYKWSLGECSNGGISSRHTQVTIMNIDGPHDAHENSPPVILVRRDVGGTPFVVAYPAVEKNGGWVKDPRWLMNGGTLIAGDSRFGEKLEEMIPGWGAVPAVKLHDRYEG